MHADWGAEATFRCTNGVVATRVGFMVRLIVGLSFGWLGGWLCVRVFGCWLLGWLGGWLIACVCLFVSHTATHVGFMARMSACLFGGSHRVLTRENVFGCMYTHLARGPSHSILPHH